MRSGRKHAIVMAGSRSRRERRTLITLLRRHDNRSSLVTTSFGSRWIKARRPIILAASVRLGRWVERNRTAAAFLQEQFDQCLIVRCARRSKRIARWAGLRTAATRVLAWVKGREFQPIDESCLLLLS